ncbi:hypothetical protein [Roseovarius arcticus]|uniref:hypothetical protein n=1 Tax=Roseovarius arcticus TaxID=2547404 RepID=UPI003CCC6E66
MTRAKAVPDTVTGHIPFRFVKRRGRKEMQLPDGVSDQRKMDDTLIKALARAFRWKRMLESAEFTGKNKMRSSLCSQGVNGNLRRRSFCIASLCAHNMNCTERVSEFRFCRVPIRSHPWRRKTHKGFGQLRDNGCNVASPTSLVLEKDASTYCLWPSTKETRIKTPYLRAVVTPYETRKTVQLDGERRTETQQPIGLWGCSCRVEAMQVK